MPYTSWFDDPPKDPTLKVSENLPDGVAESDSFHDLHEAYGFVGEEYKTYHHCRFCGGWIEGHAHELEVNNLNTRRLAGRQGTEYYCRRCGRQIGFFGLMS